MEISDDLRCVFSAGVEERDGSYVIEVPKRELELDTLTSGEVYRVALLSRPHAVASEGGEDSRNESVSASTTERSTDGAGGSASAGGSVEAEPGRPTDSVGRSSGSGSDRSRSTGGASADDPEPPVDRGDEVTVDIEGIGDQGDGIARVDRGYVIIVPDTEKGERVRIRVTSVKQNVAFAEVTERVSRQEYE